MEEGGKDHLGVDFNTLMQLYGGPYENFTWEPKPPPNVPGLKDYSHAWQINTLGFEISMLRTFTILSVAFFTLLYRSICRLISYINFVVFELRLAVEVDLEDWNDVHLMDYSRDKVEWVEAGPSEKYRFFSEDYVQLLRVLVFVDSQSAS